jgi:hypothetical protein
MKVSEDKEDPVELLRRQAREYHQAKSDQKVMTERIQKQIHRKLQEARNALAPFVGWPCLHGGVVNIEDRHRVSRGFSPDTSGDGFFVSAGSAGVVAGVNLWTYNASLWNVSAKNYGGEARDVDHLARIIANILTPHIDPNADPTEVALRRAVLDGDPVAKDALHDHLVEQTIRRPPERHIIEKGR